MANQVFERTDVPRYPEGAILRALIAPRARPIDIANAAGCSRQFVNDVLAGRRKPSAKILEACRTLGLPDHLIGGNGALESNHDTKGLTG
jgi:hypothetical protein